MKTTEQPIFQGQEKLDNGNFRIVYFFEDDGKDECSYLTVSYQDAFDFFEEEGYNLRTVDGFKPFSKYGHAQREETIEFEDFLETDTDEFFIELLKSKLD